MNIDSKIKTVFAQLFPGLEILRITPIGGGCINEAYCVILDDNQKFFLKANSSQHQNLFQSERLGLQALSSTQGPPVPKVITCATAGQTQFLVMQHIQPGRQTPSTMCNFGQQLALMHNELTSDTAGFSSNNFIGATPQINTPDTDWLRFFAQNRLLFQAQLACTNGRLSSADLDMIQQLAAKLDDYLPRPAKFSLLHGDLWGGNYLIDTNGVVVLIDPAVYYGHPEADLAMTYLFGGFDSDFYAGYNSVNPIPRDFRQRISLYNLYHLLNHLNLFGSSYYQSVISTVKNYL